MSGFKIALKQRKYGWNKYIQIRYFIILDGTLTPQHLTYWMLFALSTLDVECSQ